MGKKKRVFNYNILIVLLLMFSLGFFYLYGLLPDLSITGYQTANQVGNLTVGVATLVACTWPNAVFNISFGDSQNPGTTVNATRNFDNPNISFAGVPPKDLFNGTSYNVTIAATTNVPTNITMRGRHLVSGANVIGVTNVTWASNVTRSNGTNMLPVGSTLSNAINLTDTLNTGFPVGGLLNAGSSAWWRFWLDIPAGQTAGQYVGNFTQQCAQGN